MNLEDVTQDEGTYNDEDREALFSYFESQGYKVVKPSEYELQVDIDGREEWERHLVLRVRLAQMGLVERIEEQPSPSGLPNRHVTITLNIPLTPFSRIAFQAALGSDPMRELLSLQRAVQGIKDATVFFEKAGT